MQKAKKEALMTMWDAKLQENKDSLIPKEPAQQTRRKSFHIRTHSIVQINSTHKPNPDEVVCGGTLDVGIQKTEKMEKKQLWEERMRADEDRRNNPLSPVKKSNTAAQRQIDLNDNPSVAKVDKEREKQAKREAEEAEKRATIEKLNKHLPRVPSPSRHAAVPVAARPAGHPAVHPAARPAAGFMDVCCPGCNVELSLRINGGYGKCPNCQTEFNDPTKQDLSAAPAEPPAAAVDMCCPGCDATLTLIPNGKKTQCPMCNTEFNAKVAPDIVLVTVICSRCASELDIRKGALSQCPSCQDLIQA